MNYENEIEIDNDALNYVIKEIFPIGSGINVNITGIDYRTFVQKGLYKVNYMFEKCNAQKGVFKYTACDDKQRKVEVFRLFTNPYIIRIKYRMSYFYKCFWQKRIIDMI